MSNPKWGESWLLWISWILTTTGLCGSGYSNMTWYRSALLVDIRDTWPIHEAGWMRTCSFRGPKWFMTFKWPSKYIHWLLYTYICKGCVALNKKPKTLFVGLRPDVHISCTVFDHVFSMFWAVAQKLQMRRFSAQPFASHMAPSILARRQAA